MSNVVANIRNTIVIEALSEIRHIVVCGVLPETCRDLFMKFVPSSVLDDKVLFYDGFVDSDALLSLYPHEAGPLDDWLLLSHIKLSGAKYVGLVNTNNFSEVPTYVLTVAGQGSVFVEFRNEPLSAAMIVGLRVGSGSTPYVLNMTANGDLETVGYI